VICLKYSGKYNKDLGAKSNSKRIFKYKIMPKTVVVCFFLTHSVNILITAFKFKYSVCVREW